MSDTVIQVENLSKRYIIGHQKEGRSYVALRDVLADGAKQLARRFMGKGPEFSATREEFWALKDIAFDVKRGECVGIIGRNGAGKSTLLKILSRITEPTTGRIRLMGRVSSLLEVGTGFHPELTGRENIYLNGAILGMRRDEIKRKFDEIVAFAEVEKFLDTPVKHYSSGMYMRLAFAVAAHLEPEILVIDEVLAVGDAKFQSKCLGKMSEVAKQGRTVLFVSHNMTALANLCTKGILLRSGKIVKAGVLSEVLNLYSREVLGASSLYVSSPNAILEDVHCCPISYDPTGATIELIFKLRNVQYELGIDLSIRCEESPALFASSAYYSELEIPRGQSIVHCKIGPINLSIGKYTIDVALCRPMLLWVEQHRDVATVHVEQQACVKHSFSLNASRNLGFAVPAQTWSLVPAERLADVVR